METQELNKFTFETTCRLVKDGIWFFPVVLHHPFCYNAQTSSFQNEEMLAKYKRHPKVMPLNLICWLMMPEVSVSAIWRTFLPCYRTEFGKMPKVCTTQKNFIDTSHVEKNCSHWYSPNLFGSLKKPNGRRERS